MKILAASFGLLLLLGGCAPGTTSATSAPTPERRVRPVPARSAASSSSPRASASADRVGRRAARAASAPKAATVAAMPQILAASVRPTVVGSGARVSATVRTTPGVVSVVAFAGGTSMAVPRVGPGLFAGSTTLPPLPAFAHGSYAVTFVARDAGGRSTQSAVGVTVR